MQNASADSSNIQIATLEILEVLYEQKPNLSSVEAVICLSSIIGSLTAQYNLDKNFVFSIIELTYNEYKEKYLKEKENES